MFSYPLLMRLVLKKCTLLSGLVAASFSLMEIQKGNASHRVVTYYFHRQEKIPLLSLSAPPPRKMMNIAGITIIFTNILLSFIISTFKEVLSSGMIHSFAGEQCIYIFLLYYILLYKNYIYIYTKNKQFYPLIKYISICLIDEIL